MASAVAERIRSETLRHLKTEAKDALARVRDSLSPEDRMLLVLRVDRRLPWDEVSRILAEEELSPAEASRDAARLRKRFQTLKDEIAERMSREEEG